MGVSPKSSILESASGDDDNGDGGNSKFSSAAGKNYHEQRLASSILVLGQKRGQNRYLQVSTSGLPVFHRNCGVLSWLFLVAQAAT